MTTSDTTPDVARGNGHSPGNWGRWGPDDERGAVNFISPEHRIGAAQLVRRGLVYSLAVPLSRDRTPLSPLRTPPMHFMALDGGDFAAGAHIPGDYQCADDYLITSTQAGTHVDGLSHVWYDATLYNGHPANRIRSYGAGRLGIENLTSIVARGVLLDVAAHLGVDYLSADHVITPAELAGCADQAGVTIGRGDCVLIRTGWLRIFGTDPVRYHAASPGVGLAAAKWLAQHEVCAVAADNMAFEPTVGTAGYEAGSPSPSVHKLLIRDHGTYILELLNLEELAADPVREFLFVAAPLPIVGGIASPLNPLAIV